MKISIKDYCIRCGLCEDLYPQLFSLNHESDEIDVKFSEIPKNFMEDAKSAAADCAITAIQLVK